MIQERDLTKGAIVKSLWLFALPLMFGNVLQQFYNLVDTWVVGRYLGKRALAAVGASYTLMTFLTSVVIGLCLGAGAFFSMAYGRREKETFRNGIFMSFTAIGSLSIVLTILLYGFVRPLTYLLQVPAETVEDMVTYLIYVFAGFFAIFLYNYFASVLRSIGNSVLPLVFLGISVALNIGLDLLFVVTFSFGIAGAAVATVISQYIAGIGLMLFFLFRYSDLCPAKKDFTWEKKNFRQILSLSGFTCLQQSVMNFGILMIQGLVNSFGTTIMAAFSVAVKIDTIAYMPVQDFGNAFSFFVAQNYGAKKYSRVRKAFWFTLCASLVTMAVFAGVVYVFRRELLLQFLTDMDAYEIAFYALQIQCLTLPFIPVCICGNMLFQSIGKGGRATILASFRSGTIYIPALLILTAFWGIRGIQWSQPVSDILSAVLSLPVAVAFLKGLPEDSTEV